MQRDEARRDELVRRFAEDNLALTRAVLRERLDPLMSLTITFQQLKVLLLVVSDQGWTTHGLAERLGVSAPTTSGVVDRLVEHGYVRRVEDAADRRVRRLVPTDEGRRTAETVTNVTEWQRRQVLDRLGVEDLEALVRGVAAVRAAVERVVLPSDDADGADDADDADGADDVDDRAGIP